MNTKTLIITEKPSAARAIAAALGANVRGDGCIHGGGLIVSWCYGHLVELATPAAYDEKLAKWRREDLPIVPETWKTGVLRDKLHTLGAGYSEAELRDVIAGKATHNPRGKRERASLIVDIQAKLAAGKGGYAQWAKVFNVKQMAKTLLYLQEHGIKNREELNARADAAR